MIGRFSRRVFRMALPCAGLIIAACWTVAGAQAAGLSSAGMASAPQKIPMSQVRLLAGRQEPGSGLIIAGVEIELEDGWKTYWRNPGDAGGVSPQLNWAASENVGETELLYPAPKRFKDKSGETIGYEGSVVLPVLVKPIDPDRPVELRAQFNFGICREICIPATADLSLTVPPDLSSGLPGELTQALDRTPRSGGAMRVGDPKLVSREVVLDGSKPRIVLDVDLGPKAETGDVFAEASDGVYLPMPQPVKSRTSEVSRFEIDLTQSNDPAELKGKTVRLTMIGPAGQSEESFVVE